MRPPRIGLMRTMLPGDSILIQSRGVVPANIMATGIAAKVGGKWHTRKVYLVDPDSMRLLEACLLTCSESAVQAKPRGRPKGSKNKPRT